MYLNLRRNESLVSIATTDTALDSFITKKELTLSNDTACEDSVATNLRMTECIIEVYVNDLCDGRSS